MPPGNGPLLPNKNNFEQKMTHFEPEISRGTSDFAPSALVPPSQNPKYTTEFSFDS